jgi:hypothetical protein
MGPASFRSIHRGRSGPGHVMPGPTARAGASMRFGPAAAHLTRASGSPACFPASAAPEPIPGRSVGAAGAYDGRVQVRRERVAGVSFLPPSLLRYTTPSGPSSTASPCGSFRGRRS